MACEHRQRLCWVRAYQKDHYRCSSLPWGQLALCWNVDVGYTKFECCRVPRWSQRCFDFALDEKYGDRHRRTCYAVCLLGTDSSSAKSIMQRRGAGRDRHLHCPMLWYKKRVDSGDIRTEKRKGEHSVADNGTQAVTAEVRRHLKTLKMEWREGRHPLAFIAALWL